MIWRSRQDDTNGDREFPSLSGAPQTQQSTPAQQMWSSNANLRAQHSTIQRPQMQGQGQAQQATTPHQQIQNPLHDEGPGSAQGFATGGDDFRYGGQAGVGQLSGGAQPQTGNIEEFPPLGGGPGDVGPDRRTGMIQNAAAYQTSGNPSAFPGLGQTRNGLSSPTESQQDRSLNSAMAARGIPPSGGESNCKQSFAQMLTNASVPDAVRGYARRAIWIAGSGPYCMSLCFVCRGSELIVVQGNQRQGQTLEDMSFGNAQPQLRGGDSVLPIGQRPQQGQFRSNFGPDAGAVGSPGGQPQHKKLADMTEKERYGLPGLLSMIPLESPDYSTLAVGQDLTVLGLDLSRPE